MKTIIGATVYSTSINTCAINGTRGKIVSYKGLPKKPASKNDIQVYVLWDGCSCGKRYYGGCNGYPYNSTKNRSTYFTLRTTKTACMQCNKEINNNNDMSTMSNREQRN